MYITHLDSPRQPQAAIGLAQGAVNSAMHDAGCRNLVAALKADEAPFLFDGLSSPVVEAQGLAVMTNDAARIGIICHCVTPFLPPPRDWGPIKFPFEYRGETK